MCVVVISPMLGSRNIPSMIKVALAAFLSLIVNFYLYPINPEVKDLTYFAIILLIIKEVIIGFIFGLLTNFIFYIYECAGQWMDYFRAANSMNQLVPSLDNPSSSLGGFMFSLSLALFFSLDLHIPFFSGLLKSFILFPPQEFNVTTLEESYWLVFLEISSQLFFLALEISLPILVISLLLDICFGLLNRLVPEVNAYFLSLPVKTLVGLLMLFLTLGSLPASFSKLYQFPRL